MIIKSFKFRLYPSKDQKELIDKHIGTSRFIYNLGLETKKMSYEMGKKLSKYDLIKQLPDLKKEYGWLKEINSQTIQQSLINLDTAYQNFFLGRAKFPRFKSKHRGNNSFNVPQNVILKDDKLIIPKFKEGIKCIVHREVNGTIKQCTISRVPSGKYFVSILVETNQIKPDKPQINKVLGIDLGIKDFLITSDSEVIKNPRFLRESIKQLKYIQSRYSRFKGKKNKKKLTILHEKIVNQRKDFLNKLSTKLIRDNQSISLEDLNVSGMVKNHKLSQSISDTSWSMFVTMLEYKADWYGTNILKIGRFEPSSKTCNDCGWVNKELTLKDREWVCQDCGVIHDRDINAARNIRDFSIKKLCTEYTLKNHEELPLLKGALTHEDTPL
jgi:putative transposase